MFSRGCVVPLKLNSIYHVFEKKKSLCYSVNFYCQEFYNFKSVSCQDIFTCTHFTFVNDNSFIVLTCQF